MSFPMKRPGARLRYVVWDEYHKAMIGRLGCIALFCWAPRDRISYDMRDYCSVSRPNVGAIPPYNGILGGKLAMLMTSKKVREDFNAR